MQLPPQINYNNITTVLRLIIIALAMKIAFFAKSPIGFDNKLSQSIIDSINLRNNALKKDISEQMEKNRHFLQQADSLEKIKTKIKSNYEKKVQEINNAPVNTVADELGRLLSEGDHSGQ